MIPTVARARRAAILAFAAVALAAPLLAAGDPAGSRSRLPVGRRLRQRAHVPDADQRPPGTPPALLQLHVFRSRSAAAFSTTSRSTPRTSARVPQAGCACRPEPSTCTSSPSPGARPTSTAPCRRSPIRSWPRGSSPDSRRTTGSATSTTRRSSFFPARSSARSSSSRATRTAGRARRRTTSAATSSSSTTR